MSAHAPALPSSAPIRDLVTRADVEAARQRIAADVRATPLWRLPGAALGLDLREVWLKLEHLQVAGSFKARGMFNRLRAQALPAAGVLIASGGNGGIAAWWAGRVPIDALEPEGCPTLHAARAAGVPVDVTVGGLAADALGARRLGDIAWSVNHHIANSHLLTDVSIRDAQQWLWREMRLAVEPAAALPLAALRSGAVRPLLRERVALVLCGANLDPASLA